MVRGFLTFYGDTAPYVIRIIHQYRSSYNMRAVMTSQPAWIAGCNTHDSHTMSDNYPGQIDLAKAARVRLLYELHCVVR